MQGNNVRSMTRRRLGSCSLNGASVSLAIMNGQDKNQLNRAITAATVGKLGVQPDKQGFSGCIFCGDEKRKKDKVARPSFCNREQLTRL
jgi:hypothetical protein